MEQQPVAMDGRLVSESLQEEIRREITRLQEQTGKVPGLTVIIVGSDPASLTYVRSKDKMASRLGFSSQMLEYPADTPADVLLHKIDELNADSDTHAVLIQLPLPEQLNRRNILDHLDPEKDVDGFHPFNQGKILLNRADIFPCTPAGILKILDYYKIDLTGRRAAIVGRSFIVGKPMALMISNRNATVTLCHSKTRDLPAVVADSDVVVAAVGRPGFITADMVRPGALLIDVGINHITCDGDFEKFCDPQQRGQFEKKGYAITGDIHPDAYRKASYYTPVPGGVGPMTVTMLMYNTLQLFKRQMRVD